MPLPQPPEEELQARLAAIRAAPDQDTPRLALADWFDGLGDPRGEMIRLSVELAREPAGSSRQRELFERFSPLWGETGVRFVAWVGALNEEGVSAVPDRGLLAVRVMNGVDPEERHDAHFYAAVRQGWAGRVEFIDSEGRPFRALARGGWPSLRSVPVITAVGQTETEDNGLAGVGGLANLRELIHDDDRGRAFRILTDAGLAHLRRLPNLERVQLYGRFTCAGVLGLASLPRLRQLELDGVSGNLADLAAEFRRLAPRCEVSLAEVGAYGI